MNSKTLFLTLSIFFLITGLILFYYILGVSIFFIILSMIFIILYLTSKSNKSTTQGGKIITPYPSSTYPYQTSIYPYPTSTSPYPITSCVKKCERNCGQDDGCATGTYCKSTLITDTIGDQNKTWSLITSSGTQYDNYIILDLSNTIYITDKKTLELSIYISTSGKKISIETIQEKIISGIKYGDTFTFNETGNYYICSRDNNILIFPTMCKPVYQ